MTSRGGTGGGDQRLAIAWGYVRLARVLVADVDEFLVAEVGDVEVHFEAISGLQPAFVHGEGLDARAALFEAERLLRAAGRSVPLGLWAACRAVQGALS